MNHKDLDKIVKKFPNFNLKIFIIKSSNINAFCIVLGIPDIIFSELKHIWYFENNHEVPKTM